jgi:hypothetical protein
LGVEDIAVGGGGRGTDAADGLQLVGEFGDGGSNAGHFGGMVMVDVDEIEDGFVLWMR